MKLKTRISLKNYNLNKSKNNLSLKSSNFPMIDIIDIQKPIL
jgi:hypothetical protein